MDRNGGSFSTRVGHLGLTLLLVGTIRHQTNPPENTWPRGPLDITILTRLFTRGRSKNKATNRVTSLKPRPSLRHYPPPRLPPSLEDIPRPSVSDTHPKNPFITSPHPLEHESPQERSRREQEEARANVVNQTINEQIKLDEVAFRRYQKAIKVLVLGQSESG